ncbi:MAG TPA: hypothetical protein VMD75_15840 [Candidatus Binataceae bacterium]|nr:hypothetical protein [Candidatus Binataceae bacterium]
MARKRPIFDALLNEILAAAEETPASELVRPEETAVEINSLSALDYAQALRQCLSRQEVGEVVRIARHKVWPELNQRPVELISPQEFARRWSGLGVDFRTADWTWPEGLALVGVYLKKAKGVLKRPVICINTAHHPAMVGAAFDHEMGHHLTAQIFDSRHEPAHFLTYTGYAAHLHEPAELAADLMVSLGAYPQQEARKIFNIGQAGSGSRGQEAAAAPFEKAVRYVAKRYGLNFSAEFSTEKKLQCLAALIHYTKLRQALLEEYDL